MGTTHPVVVNEPGDIGAENVSFSSIRSLATETPSGRFASFALMVSAGTLHRTPVSRAFSGCLREGARSYANSPWKKAVR